MKDIYQQLQDISQNEGMAAALKEAAYRAAAWAEAYRIWDRCGCFTDDEMKRMRQARVNWRDAQRFITFNRPQKIKP
jgi:hypothetical protein